MVLQACPLQERIQLLEVVAVDIPLVNSSGFAHPVSSGPFSAFRFLSCNRPETVIRATKNRKEVQKRELAGIDPDVGEPTTSL